MGAGHLFRTALWSTASAAVASGSEVVLGALPAWSGDERALAKVLPKLSVRSTVALDVAPVKTWEASGRRLSALRPCENHSSCEPNEYCMDCARCAAFHASLSSDMQERWTCEPCEDGSTHCESGRYCGIAQDAVDGRCPAFVGCAAHSDCRDNEYCFSCEKCRAAAEALGSQDAARQCLPCDTAKGGACAMVARCSTRQDAVDGECPEPHGCAQHSDCLAGQYCESCTECEAFQQALPPHLQARWSCAPCPTLGGGICEALRFCQMAHDSIDGTCPQPWGCNSHVQCLPDEYCSSCVNCTRYHDSLPPEQKGQWNCEPCPTQRGGNCELRQFCQVADDAMGGGTCPEYKGCGEHEGCGSSEFCMSWASCDGELGDGNCGVRPTQGGLCLRNAYCTPARSVNGRCFGAAGCDGHDECAADHFCTPWEECMKTDPSKCGPRSMHREGVCLELSHCVRGLHAPIDGSCPAWSERNAGRGRLEVREGLRLEGTLQLATHHQAMNVWLAEGSEERVLAQLHDYGSSPDALDDVEHVAVWRASGGQLMDQRLVGLSCPAVEVAIPAEGMHFYETRIHLSEFEMSARHAECSCVLTESSGRCPRGVMYEVPTDPGDGSCQRLGQSPGNGGGKQGASVVFVQNNRMQELATCMGSIHVDTDVSFHIQNASQACRINYYRLDMYEMKTFTLGGSASANVSVKFDGQFMTCYSGSGNRNACQGLHEGVAIPVVIISMDGPADNATATSGEGMCGVQGVRYCAACHPVLPHMRPVLFLNAAGAAMPNNLTLYSLDHDLRAGARLVNSSLVRGVGAPELGCPLLEDPSALGPTLQQLRERSQVLPQEHVAGLWCVVRTGGCSLAAKYKLCALGGARGVLFVDSPGEEEPATEIRLGQDAQHAFGVPALFAAYDAPFLHALNVSASPLMLSAGPSIGARRRPGYGASPGGIRSYNLETGHWRRHMSVPGAMEWMEHSPIRKVLFVCTSNRRIVALDTARPDEGLPILGWANASEPCHTAPYFRDYHVAEVRQGERFFTVLIDAQAAGNRLVFYDTTDLAAWRRLSEVHADWEHNAAGLGQVVPTRDGSKLLVTWHCSTLYCAGGGGGEGADARPGERLYVLDLRQGLADGEPPPVIGIVKLPMSQGSIVRDITCNDQDICLASLSWDGIVAIDLARGPNRFRVIAQHSEMFRGPNIPAQAAFARMVSGAQKVYPSRKTSGRFYVERWSLDMELFLTGARLSKCLRYDSVWAVDLDGYTRPAAAVTEAFEPPVTATLVLAAPASRPQFLAGQLEHKVEVGLRDALNIDYQRLEVTGFKEAGENVLVDFRIITGAGPSPEALYVLLQRQLETPGSAIHTGPLASYIAGARFERRGPSSGGSSTSSDSRGSSATSSTDAGLSDNPHGNSSAVLLLVCFLGLSVGLSVWAICFALRAHQQVRQAEAAGAAPRWPDPVGAGGFVIGRPGDSLAGGSEANPAASTAVATAAGTTYVVGAPVARGAAAAAAATATGTALSHMDCQKLAPPDGGAPASSSSGPGA